MKKLEERIQKDGKVRPGGILKVDNFLNHQIDPQLLYDMAQELKWLYEGERVNKILTVEAKRKTSPTKCGRLMWSHSPTGEPTRSSYQRNISEQTTGC